MSKISQGWGHPLNSRKFHYFRNCQSLCNRWMFFGRDLDDDKNELADECQECRKRLNKESKKDDA